MSPKIDNSSEVQGNMTLISFKMDLVAGPDVFVWVFKDHDAGRILIIDVPCCGRQALRTRFLRDMTHVCNPPGGRGRCGSSSCDSISKSVITFLSFKVTVCANQLGFCNKSICFEHCNCQESNTCIILSPWE